MLETYASFFRLHIPGSTPRINQHISSVTSALGLVSSLGGHRLVSTGRKLWYVLHLCNAGIGRGIFQIRLLTSYSGLNGSKKPCIVKTIKQTNYLCNKVTSAKIQPGATYDPRNAGEGRDIVVSVDVTAESRE